MTVAVGILDSGVDNGLAVDAARFAINGDGSVGMQPPAKDQLGHGTAMAQLIRRRAPTVRFYSAQVFNDRGFATPVTVAAGLAWLVGQGVRLVNMSFGLVDDREPLRQACAESVAAGVLIVASVPAMGPQVYPAAYPGIVRATGDGRCCGDEVAAICSKRADFGANPAFDACTTAPVRIAGASVAAARITGALAAMLAATPASDPGRLLQDLIASATHRGSQRAGVNA